MVASSTVLPFLAVPLGPASATAEPTIDRSVHFSFRQVDLTHGRQTLVLRVKGSADERLVLNAVQLTDQPSGGGVFISTDAPGNYRLDYQPLRKLSGDARHGVWRARIRLNRHLPADTYDVVLFWRVGGVLVWSTLGRTLTITNAHPDTHPPVMVALNRPAAGATVSHKPGPRVSMHLRDRGVGVSLVWVCYHDVAGDPGAPGALQCDEARRSSGTKNDGVWTTRLTRLGKLDPGGVVLRITTYDWVTLMSEWTPADAAELPYDQTIPGGRGHITLTD